MQAVHLEAPKAWFGRIVEMKIERALANSLSGRPLQTPTSRAPGAHAA
jgi:hypothetical protein